MSSPWQSALVSCLCCLLILSANNSRAKNITPDVVYGHKAGMALTYDVVAPDEPNGAAVVFIMSGGWFSTWAPPELMVGDKVPHGMHHFRELVEDGYTLYIVRHGSAPYFKVPDAVADVRLAIRHIRHQADRFDVDPERIGVCGASAGGHLSLMLGTTPDDGREHATNDIERTTCRVAAVVAYFPPVKLEEFLDLKKDFPALDFDPELADSVSPLLHVTDDDAPTLLVHGDRDDLVKLDNSERIHDAFEKVEVPTRLIVMKGSGHGFLGKAGSDASAALVAWFDEHLAADGDAGTEDATSDAHPDENPAAAIEQ